MKLSDFKIFVLHLSNKKDRMKNIDKLKKELSSDLDIWWACNGPIDKEIGENCESLRTEYYDSQRRKDNLVYDKVYNCALNHYSIIKTSYERGFENIMILEDDVRLKNGKKGLIDVLEKLPSNYVIAKLYYTNQQLYESADSETFLAVKKLVKNNEWFLSTAAYCLSREGMKRMIKAYDKILKPADLMFKETRDIVCQKCVFDIDETLPGSIV